MIRSAYAAVADRLRKGPTATYEDADLVETVFRKTVAARAAQPIDAVTAKLALAWLIGSPRRVLDFGGACGGRYFALRDLIPADVTWHVVETPAMVARARELEDDRLRFHVGMRVRRVLQRPGCLPGSRIAPLRTP